MNDISAAMARDAARESMRFFATADDLYAWICVEGNAFVEQYFAGRLSEPWSTNDAERLAAYMVGGGARFGSVIARYRVVPAGSIADREIVDLFVETVWLKPRFLADGLKAGEAISAAMWGLWNRAEQRFDKVPD